MSTRKKGIILFIIVIIFSMLLISHIRNCNSKGYARVNFEMMKMYESFEALDSTDNIIKINIELSLIRNDCMDMAMQLLFINDITTISKEEKRINRDLIDFFSVISNYIEGNQDDPGNEEIINNLLHDVLEIKYGLRNYVTSYEKNEKEKLEQLRMYFNKLVEDNSNIFEVFRIN